MRRQDDKRALHRAVVARVLSDDGATSRESRRAAFDNAVPSGPLGTLIDKVATSATTVTDEDFAAAKADGLPEDQIFELVFCAVIGQATRQYERAHAALDEATRGTEGGHAA